MELVAGIPVTEYCDQARLSARDRLALMVSICMAVQHAHQKGVIHRDLKPTNVLVSTQDGSPLPKVIDFGIAKATEGQLTDDLLTGCAQILGTPLYMSPEQAAMHEMDVDTRSDVYSLGVMLYELLTGTTPFDRTQIGDASFDEIRRIIRDDEPPRPSTRLSTVSATQETVAERRGTDVHALVQQVRGELDWIVMKALEKDRARRYESASALARDIQRYLRDEAVEACPPSRLYRFHKFVRRNRVAFVSTVLVGLSLLAGATVATWQSIRATREGRRATRESHRVGQERNRAESARADAEGLASLGLEVLDEIYLGVLGDRLARQPQVSSDQRQLLQAGLDYYQQFVQRTHPGPDRTLVIANAHRQIGLIL
jgi:hypothetical protein